MSTAPVQAIRELDKADLLQLVDYCSEHSKLPENQVLGKFALKVGIAHDLSPALLASTPATSPLTHRIHPTTHVQR
jgi:hypothetical protein